MKPKGVLSKKHKEKLKIYFAKIEDANTKQRNNKSK